MAYVNQGHYREILKQKRQADEHYNKVMNNIDENDEFNWSDNDFTDFVYDFDFAFSSCLEAETALDGLLKNQTLLNEQDKYENMLDDVKNKKEKLLYIYRSNKRIYINGASGLSEAEEETLENLTIEKYI